MDVGELTAAARAIARGAVVDVRSEWAPGRRGVQTRVTIEVSEYLKGVLDSRITLVVPGGRMGRYRSVTLGAPRFASGQSVIVFLTWRDPSAPYLVGFSQGVFRVVRDPATSRDMVTPRPLVARGGIAEAVTRGDPDRRLPEVGEFMALIRTLVAERTP
jgi:hypothetical protein